MREELVEIDFITMSEHAAWWANESGEAQQRLATNPEQLEAARAGFGKIGSSSVGGALAEVLLARDAWGRQQAHKADEIHQKMARDLQTYADVQDENIRLLKSDDDPLPPYPYPGGGEDIGPSAPAAPGELPPYPYPRRRAGEDLEPWEVENPVPGETRPANR